MEKNRLDVRKGPTERGRWREHLQIHHGEHRGGGEIHRQARL